MDKQKFSIKFSKNKIINFLILFVFASLVLVGILLLIPAVQNIGIKIGETLAGRELRDYDKWYRMMKKVGIVLIVLDIVSILVILFFIPKFDKSAPSVFSFNIFSLKEFSQNKFFYFAACFVFIILVIFQFIWISQKEGFMVDEPLSISICNRNEYGFWGEDYETGKEFSGNELKNISLWDNGSVKDTISDVAHLWVNNHDNAHTNFYYSALRIWFIGNTNNNLKYIVWRGCLLNVLFFAVGFYFMLLILLTITKSNFWCLIALAIAFGNKLYITNILLLRTYALQSTCLIIFSYVFICYFNAIKHGQIFFNRKDFFISALLISFTMLSGYYSLIYICLLGLAILIIAMKKKSFDLAKYFIFSLYISLVFSKILYLDFASGIFTGRGEESFAKFNILTLPQDLIKTLKLFASMISENYMTLSLLLSILILSIIIGIILLSETTKSKTIASDKIINIFSAKNIIAFMSVVWSILVLYFSPLLAVRHIAPIAPLASLIVLHPCNDRNNYKKIFVVNAAICIPLIFILSWKIIPTKKQIDSMPYIKSSYANFMNDFSIPIVIHGEINWEYATIIPYINDEQKYFFVNGIDDLKKINLTEKNFWFVEQESLENKIVFPESYKIIEPTKNAFAYWEETLIQQVIGK